MASAGPNGVGTAAEDTSIGSAPWNNLGRVIGNITASDNTYAEADCNFGTPSTYYAKATNFGFSIPAGATIDGIVVEWEIKSNNSILDNAVRIVKGGTIGSTDKSNGSYWPASDTYRSYGGAADLWGETWASTDINASTFGAAISAKRDGSGSHYPDIDHVRITVYYTAGGGGGSGGAAVSPNIRRFSQTRHGIYTPIGPKGIYIG